MQKAERERLIVSMSDLLCAGKWELFRCALGLGAIVLAVTVLPSAEPAIQPTAMSAGPPKAPTHSASKAVFDERRANFAARKPAPVAANNAAMEAPTRRP